jgi:hypothetical protein
MGTTGQEVLEWPVGSVVDGSFGCFMHGYSLYIMWLKYETGKTRYNRDNSKRLDTWNACDN